MDRYLGNVYGISAESEVICHACELLVDSTIRMWQLKKVFQGPDRITEQRFLDAFLVAHRCVIM